MSEADVTLWPATEVIWSPAPRPAWAAADPDTTPEMVTPVPLAEPPPMLPPKPPPVLPPISPPKPPGKKPPKPPGKKPPSPPPKPPSRSEEHTSELQSRRDLVCRLLLEKKKKKKNRHPKEKKKKKK